MLAHMSKFFAPVVVLMLVAVAPAQGQQTEKQKAAAIKRAAASPVFQAPKDAVLTEVQKTKLQAMTDEYAPKLAALNTKQSEILTKEQQTARAAATKANQEAKKTGKEAQAAISAALNLTEEQKPKWQAAQKEIQDLRKVIEGKKKDILSAAS